MKNLVLFDADCESFIREALGLTTMGEKDLGRWGYIKKEGEVKGFVDIIEHVVLDNENFNI